jgi:transposase
MVRPYSEDLRARVIAAVEEDGLSRREAARRYRVSESSAIKWVRAYKRTGRIRARAMGGDRRSVLKPQRAWLQQLIEQERGFDAGGGGGSAFGRARGEGGCPHAVAFLTGSRAQL